MDPPMRILGMVSRQEYCYCCLDYGPLKSFCRYPLQSEGLKYVLQETHLTICNYCVNRLKQAEQVMYNLEMNLRIWKSNTHATQELLHTERLNLNPLSNLSLSQTKYVEIVYKPEIINKIEHVDIRQKPPFEMKREAKETKEIRNEKKVKNIKKESVMDDIPAPSPAPEPEPDYVNIEGENFDKHLEAFNAAMSRRTKLITGTTKTVPDRVYIRRPNKRYWKYSKTDKTKIEIVRITRDECMKEREQMLVDPKYIEAPFKCEPCLKGFAYKTAFERHLFKHSPESGDYECDICTQRVDTEEKMHMHKKYHFVRYKCSECSLSRICRSTILDHFLANHSKDTPQLQCPHCPKVFKRMITRKKHIRYHHTHSSRVSCQYCPKTYSNNEVLRMHYINHHAEEISESPQRRPYVCEDCGKSFTAPSHLKKHQVRHTDTKDFYCVECDKSFKSDSILKHHLKTATPHVNYNELPFPCPHCEKRFSVRRDLEYHMNGTHLKIKPYQCDKCDRAYSSKCSLSKHTQVVHNGKLPAKRACPMCDKRFDNLKNHMRTHTGERPFECPHCPMKFSQSSILSTHIKLIHLKLTRSGLKKPDK